MVMAWHLAPGLLQTCFSSSVLNVYLSNSVYGLMHWAIIVKLPSGQVLADDKSTLATSQYLSRYWSRSVSLYGITRPQWVNTLRPRQNGRHFPEDIFKCIFLNESIWILIEASLKFVPTGPINNIPALIQIMAWRQPGNKPLSEPMLVCLLMHICVIQPQWVNQDYYPENVALPKQNIRKRRTLWFESVIMCYEIW